SAAVAWRIWRETRGERPGKTASLLEVGEGRTRFLALVGILMGLGFAIAIVFDTVVLLVVPLCAG
ncbi:MAG: hypothetical protein M3Y41_09110, partial [Pseudomonadota bacterium]|nr:hypothetical protein [Pseudomonadota bacterium]